MPESPGISGMSGIVPAAMMNFRAERVSPPARMRCGSRKRASAWITRMPIRSKVSGRSFS